ncbi:MAG: hypothetical protein CSA58_02860 [Micrococcales bacterium]|nr:MAG: hypothetical protein CSB46_02710 [Micrococcales bacterium]PIE27708.1 MAG: hypothetical protein CSA58_02860 [Micrococcales bacterium]
MSVLEAVLIALAGVCAGTINTIVGSGTLITFPALIGFGYPPVVANISNNLGLVPGGVAGTWGYRSELRGQSRLLKTLVPMSLIGSVAGATALLVLPAAAFDAVVPVLIAASLMLVVTQPRIQARMKRIHEHTSGSGRIQHPALLRGGVLGAGIYGGYFGAAQGVLLLGLLGSLLPEDLQRINAAKNVLGTVVNFVAAVVFTVVAFDQVDWAVAGLISVGSVGGGLIGARVGRRLSPTLLRAVILAVGTAAIVRLLFT